MKQHYCQVIVENSKMNAEQVRFKVLAGNAGNEKDGIEVVKIMIGRRLANEKSDRAIASLFSQTWKISEYSISNIISSRHVTEHKSRFQ